MFKKSLLLFFIISLTFTFANDKTQEEQPKIQEEHSYEDLPTNYKNLPANDKQKLLQDRLQSGKWNKLPKLVTGGWGSILDNFSALLNLAATFNHQGDELPVDWLGYRRVKFIHSYGVAGKIEYIPTSKGKLYFTGIYRSGAIGIARLSLAGAPDSLGYTPGMAVKFLKDGQPSVNIFVMFSLNGQGENHDWFAKNFTNILPSPDGWALQQLEKIFATVHKPPTHLSVDHLGAQDKTGKSEKINRSPFQLILKPSQDTKGIIQKNTKEDFRNELVKIEEGKILYEVWSRDRGAWEQDKAGSKNAVHIGNIVLKSRLIASHYSDKILFFKHDRPISKK